jgi:hypothetical protein
VAARLVDADRAQAVSLPSNSRTQHAMNQKSPGGTHTILSACAIIAMHGEFLCRMIAFLD